MISSMQIGASPSQEPGPSGSGDVLSSSSSDTGEEIKDCSEDNVASGQLNSMVLSGDFGRVVKLKTQRNLTDDERYYLLKHHFVPNKNYKFPAHPYGDRQRHFQNSWLDEYIGLTYSETDDGGYFKFCVLFAQCQPQVLELGVLVNRPLTNLKKAREKLNSHFVSKERKSHQEAVEKALAFCAVRENRVLPIDQQLS